MMFLLQAPIVVDLTQQPPVSPEITYTEVILGAVGVAGMIMVLACLVGLATGGAIIYIKKRAERSGKEPDAPTQLRI
jgi:hypothetical protein